MFPEQELVFRDHSQQTNTLSGIRLTFHSGAHFPRSLCGAGPLSNQSLVWLWSGLHLKWKILISSLKTHHSFQKLLLKEHLSFHLQEIILHSQKQPQPLLLEFPSWWTSQQTWRDWSNWVIKSTLLIYSVKGCLIWIIFMPYSPLETVHSSFNGRQSSEEPESLASCSIVRSFLPGRVRLVKKDFFHPFSKYLLIWTWWSHGIW